MDVVNSSASLPYYDSEAEGEVDHDSPSLSSQYDIPPTPSPTSTNQNLTPSLSPSPALLSCVSPSVVGLALVGHQVSTAGGRSISDSNNSDYGRFSVTVTPASPIQQHKNKYRSEQVTEVHSDKTFSSSAISSSLCSSSSSSLSSSSTLLPTISTMSTDLSTSVTRSSADEFLLESTSSPHISSSNTPSYQMFSNTSTSMSTHDAIGNIDKISNPTIIRTLTESNSKSYNSSPNKFLSSSTQQSNQSIIKTISNQSEKQESQVDETTFNSSAANSNAGFATPVKQMHASSSSPNQQIAANILSSLSNNPDQSATTSTPSTIHSAHSNSTSISTSSSDYTSYYNHYYRHYKDYYSKNPPAALSAAKASNSGSFAGTADEAVLSAADSAASYYATYYTNYKQQQREKLQAQKQSTNQIQTIKEKASHVNSAQNNYNNSNNTNNTSLLSNSSVVENGNNIDEAAAQTLTEVKHIIDSRKDNLHPTNPPRSPSSFLSASPSPTAEYISSSSAHQTDINHLDNHNNSHDTDDDNYGYCNCSNCVSNRDYYTQYYAQYYKSNSAGELSSSLSSSIAASSTSRSGGEGSMTISVPTTKNLGFNHLSNNSSTREAYHNYYAGYYAKLGYPCPCSTCSNNNSISVGEMNSKNFNHHSKSISHKSGNCNCYQCLNLESGTSNNHNHNLNHSGNSSSNNDISGHNPVPLSSLLSPSNSPHVSSRALSDLEPLFNSSSVSSHSTGTLSMLKSMNSKSSGLKRNRGRLINSLTEEGSEESEEGGRSVYTKFSPTPLSPLARNHNLSSPSLRPLQSNSPIPFLIHSTMSSSGLSASNSINGTRVNSPSLTPSPPPLRSPPSLLTSSSFSPVFPSLAVSHQNLLSNVLSPQPSPAFNSIQLSASSTSAAGAAVTGNSSASSATFPPPAHPRSPRNSYVRDVTNQTATGNTTNAHNSSSLSSILPSHNNHFASTPSTASFSFFSPSPSSFSRSPKFGIFSSLLNSPSTFALPSPSINSIKSNDQGIGSKKVSPRLIPISRSNATIDISGKKSNSPVLSSLNSFLRSPLLPPLLPSLSGSVKRETSSSSSSSSSGMRGENKSSQLSSKSNNRDDTSPLQLSLNSDLGGAMRDEIENASSSLIKKDSSDDSDETDTDDSDQVEEKTVRIGRINGIAIIPPSPPYQLLKPLNDCNYNIPGSGSSSCSNSSPRYQSGMRTRKRGRRDSSDDVLFRDSTSRRSFSSSSFTPPIYPLSTSPSLSFLLDDEEKQDDNNQVEIKEPSNKKPRGRRGRRATKSKKVVASSDDRVLLLGDASAMSSLSTLSSLATNKGAGGRGSFTASKASVSCHQCKSRRVVAQLMFCCNMQVKKTNSSPIEEIAQSKETCISNNNSDMNQKEKKEIDQDHKEIECNTNHLNKDISLDENNRVRKSREMNVLDKKPICITNINSDLNDNSNSEIPVTSLEHLDSNTNRGSKPSSSSSDLGSVCIDDECEDRPCTTHPTPTAPAIPAPAPAPATNLNCFIQLCRKKYCGICLMKFYGEEYSFEQQTISQSYEATWLCPGCRGVCSCAACRRRKERDGVSTIATNGKINPNPIHLLDSEMNPRDFSPKTALAYALVYAEKELTEKMKNLDNSSLYPSPSLPSNNEVKSVDKEEGQIQIGSTRSGRLSTFLRNRRTSTTQNHHQTNNSTTNQEQHNTISTSSSISTSSIPVLSPSLTSISTTSSSSTLLSSPSSSLTDKSVDITSSCVSNVQCDEASVDSTIFI